MASPRYMHNLTMLADGTVFANNASPTTLRSTPIRTPPVCRRPDHRRARSDVRFGNA